MSCDELQNDWETDSGTKDSADDLVGPVVEDGMLCMEPSRPENVKGLQWGWDRQLCVSMLLLWMYVSGSKVEVVCVSALTAFTKSWELGRLAKPSADSP